MSRRCDLTGKQRLIVNNVSHAHNKTKSKSFPNLQSKKVYDPETGLTLKLKLSTRAIKSLDKIGSLSKFVRKHPECLG